MDDETFCCPMRRHFLVGIIGVREDEPAPVDVADFVIQWEPKVLIRIKHCPFCGDELPREALMRIPS